MNNKNLKLKEMLVSAFQNHQKGNLIIAQNLYKKILNIYPSHIATQNNLGALLIQKGESDKAMRLLQKILQIEPNNVNANENLGIIFKNSIEYQKAIECHKRVLQVDPKHASAHNNLGLNYRQLGKYEIAKSHFHKAIEINSNHADAYNNLGILLIELGEHEKALNALKKALKLRTTFLKAQANIATAYTSQLKNIEKAISESHKTSSMHHKLSKFFSQQIPLFRLKHDVQQAKYLKSKNYKIDGLEEFNKIGEEILNRRENKESKNNFNKKILLKENEIKFLSPFYKTNYIYKTSNISNGVINSDINWGKVEMEYLNSPNQIIYIDNFLGEKAIQEIREFCLASKLWFYEFNNKYLGSFSESGFISPIHCQIATELQKKLPRLFGKYNLGKFWGFKYDTTLGKGIGIHADFAYLNLNFWITPDKYNNKKNKGGLKIYDASTPEDWSFAKYNNNTKNIYKFLNEKNAKCTNIPYKFNRAVLFNSAYFHETDEINFKDKYEGRRINITYLFGTRLIKKTIS